jgi:cbb3-type cytochrome oxidase subunit 3
MNWVPLIAAISAAGLFLIIIGAVGYVCYKFRRSDNVGDAAKF